MQTYEINLWKDKVIVEKIVKQFESDDKVLDYIANNFDTSPTPNYPSLSNSTNLGGGTIDHKTQMERIEVSKQYSIVPAYNKGPYMVVGKEDLKTAGRKV